MSTDWHIYPDARDLPARWLNPDKCPPWRRPHKPWDQRTDQVAPVARRFEEADEGARRDRERADHYVSSGLDEATQVNLALLLRRPLLVRGVPGIGKSALAYHIARKLDLGRPFRWEIRSSTTLQDGLYTYDAVGHFHQGKDSPIQNHIRLGPLGTVMVPTDQPACLLVDELDKASYDLPNDLLHVFEEGSFRIPELDRSDEVTVHTLDGREARVIGGEIRCHHHPVIVITTNDEREFPSAFLRRCVELRLKVPDATQIRAIARAWFPNDEDFDAVLQRLANQPTDRLLQALFLNRVHHTPVEELEKGLTGHVDE